jgi:serine/threonine protein kinase
LADAIRDYGSCAPAGTVARELVDRAILTPYQAQRLLSEEPGYLVLGQYRILEEIGRGGMGCVYKAMHTVMGRTVALKVISPDQLSDPAARALFRREVRLTTVFDHPNIVRAYDAGEADEICYLVMEYIDGASLDTIVRRHGRLPIALACAWLYQAADALCYAHGRGLVHRDLKPANLLVSPWDAATSVLCLGSGPIAGNALPTIKVLDFGIARLRSPTTDTISVTPASVIGTPDFIAPEQAQNIHAADIRSDLYSLGCTFYFALTGDVPFPGESAMEKLLHHVLDVPRAIESVRPDIPRELALVLRRLMDKEPNRRYQTPTELLQVVARCRVATAPTVVETVGAHAVERRDLAQCPLPAGASASEDRETPRPVVLLGNEAHRVWRHWLRLIETCIGRKVNHWQDEPAYSKLHAQVLATCDDAIAAGSPQCRATFETLRARIKPFLTWQALATTERDILIELLAACRLAEERLWKPVSRTPLLVLLAFVTVLGFLVAWNSIPELPANGSIFEGMLEMLRGCGTSLVRWILANPALASLCAGVSAVIAGISFVTRLRRH